MLTRLCDRLTLITSRERLHEPSVAVQHYPLRSLEVAAWEQFFQLRQLAADTPALAALHHAYGGNAKAMEILSSVIKQDYSENIEAYWQENQNDLLIERDLEDLVTSQFDRLQAQDEDAYKLLCRMGCYRYQDVPTVPIEGLFCLLWDVPENRHKRVVRVLQERSLVDVKDREYWLHPVIRGEAISRRREGKDWEITNRKAAESWTKSIEIVETIEDALKALEAYHHYIEVSDQSSASYIILNTRPDRREGYIHDETLGGSFYRLGLFKQMISAITKIVNRLGSGWSLSYMYHLLGDFESSIGSIYQAEEFYRKSGSIATEILGDKDENNTSELFALKKRKIESLVNIGLCKIELWELEEAIKFIESAWLKIGRFAKETILESKIEENRFYKAIEICIYSYLGFLYSETSNIKKSISFVSRANALIGDISCSNNDLGLWIKASSFLFLGFSYTNLKDFKNAFEMYNEVIALLNKLDYLQLKSEALTGLAVLCHEQGDFQTALSYHLESISISNEVGAKSSLAKAYYQIGITYQKMNETGKSNASFQEAIRFFTEMEAPKQVERVRRSMEG